MKFSIIVAVDLNMGIGINNKLPWKIKEDLMYFNRITTSAPKNRINALIMGKNTWDSLPKNSQPLKDRINIVLYNNDEDLDLHKDVYVANSFNDAFLYLNSLNNVNEVFVIGGASVYSQAINLQNLDKIYLTQIDFKFNCDTFFPKLDKNRFKLISSSESFKKDDFSYKFLVYKKIV